MSRPRPRARAWGWPWSRKSPMNMAHAWTSKTASKTAWSWAPKYRYHSRLRRNNSPLACGGRPLRCSQGGVRTLGRPGGVHASVSDGMCFRKKMANILVVDDELGIRDLLSEILNDEGHNVELAENAAQARGARNRSRPDLVLLDIWMPDTDGVTLLKEWSTTGLLSMPVIMMSGHATIETAVEATKIGAQSFLEKPITMQKLLKAVEAGLARNASATAPRKPGAA